MHILLHRSLSFVVLAFLYPHVSLSSVVRVFFAAFGFLADFSFRGLLAPDSRRLSFLAVRPFFFSFFYFFIFFFFTIYLWLLFFYLFLFLVSFPHLLSRRPPQSSVRLVSLCFLHPTSIFLPFESNLLFLAWRDLVCLVFFSFPSFGELWPILLHSSEMLRSILFGP